jgi:ligand-binding sensor domain-containing protein
LSVVGVVALLAAALHGAPRVPPKAATHDAKGPARSSWAVASKLAQEVRFEQLTRAGGIPLDRVYQVLQDHRGFIWFTTMEALVRHDGYQHIRYPGMPLVASPYTTNRLPGILFEDTKGRLWVATGIELCTIGRDIGARSLRVGPGDRCLYPAQDRREHRRWRTRWHPRIEEDRRGGLWLGTSIGLLCFDPSSNHSGITAMLSPAHALPGHLLAASFGTGGGI